MNSDQSYCNGRIGISTSETEMRMSHWVRSPIVTDLVSGDILLDLNGSFWDLMSVSSSEFSVDLLLRKYPGTGEFVVVRVSVEPTAFQFNGKVVDASELMALLDAHV